MYHDVLLQFVIVYDYGFINWGIIYDYHTQDRFLSSFISSSSSSSSSIFSDYHTESQDRFCLLVSLFLLVLVLLRHRHLFCSSFFLLFGSFSLKSLFFFCFLLGFYLHFFINTYYTCFFKFTLNTLYWTNVHEIWLNNIWGIVRTIQIMRYYMYLNVKYGYVNNHDLMRLLSFDWLGGWSLLLRIPIDNNLFFHKDCKNNVRKK